MDGGTLREERGKVFWDVLMLGESVKRKNQYE